MDPNNYPPTSNTEPPSFVVPQLQLHRLKDMQACNQSNLAPPLTGGSDRSTATLPSGNPFSPPNSHRMLSARNNEPFTPHSDADCSTPRAGIDFNRLSIHSLNNSPASFMTPRTTPRSAICSPRSPAMMSPLVSARQPKSSPCSKKLGTGCTKISSNGVLEKLHTETQSPRRPSAQRALPFSEPTPAALAAKLRNAQLQSKSKRLSQHRELSFSDLLARNGSAHGGNAIALGPPQAVVYYSSPSKEVSLKPIGKGLGSPMLVCGVHTASDAVETTPTKAGRPPKSPGCMKHSIEDALELGGSIKSPRKRPRKNTAPQRADFGADVSVSPPPMAFHPSLNGSRAGSVVSLAAAVMGDYHQGSDSCNNNNHSSGLGSTVTN